VKAEFGSDYGGWGFHSLGLDGYSNYTIDQANNIPDSQLQTNAFFSRRHMRPRCEPE
jgi:hypothetical protein